MRSSYLGRRRCRSRAPAEDLDREHYEDSQEGGSILQQKCAAAIEHRNAVGDRAGRAASSTTWTGTRGPGRAYSMTPRAPIWRRGRYHRSRVMQRRDERISYRREVEERLKEIFDGRDLEPVRRQHFDAICTRMCCTSRLFVAAAHARRRRQRAHQHPGELQRLRHDARGGPASWSG
ncbi:MAG: hypothetical protein U5L11_09200 [Arhodomonas sp.]|nr:hypothetical protein [Arhodomonas sp.]